MQTTRAYWKAVLDNGRELNEQQHDWTLDLVACHDVWRIRELWLITPVGSVMLPLHEKGTAFQLKAASFAPGIGHRVEAQIVGRVDDKLSGACSCFIWDEREGRLFAYQSSIMELGSWRTGVYVGAIDPTVQGLIL